VNYESTTGLVIECISLNGRYIDPVAGGDKRTQQVDIERAIAIAEDWE